MAKMKKSKSKASKANPFTMTIWFKEESPPLVVECSGFSIGTPVGLVNYEIDGMVHYINLDLISRIDMPVVPPPEDHH